MVSELDQFEALESIALQLPRDQRVRLTERLLASLDEDPMVEQAWQGEIARRLQAYRAGEMRTYSSDEVDEFVEAMLRSSGDEQ